MNVEMEYNKSQGISLYICGQLVFFDVYSKTIHWEKTVITVILDYWVCVFRRIKLEPILLTFLWTEHLFNPWSCELVQTVWRTYFKVP